MNSYKATRFNEANGYTYIREIFLWTDLFKYMKNLSALYDIKVVLA